MKNLKNYSWQIPKKVEKKSKKWKIFGYIFLWGFFIFSALVSADYYFFYQENKKYFSDQKSGFELIGENLKNNLEQKNFSELEKNILVLEEKISLLEKNFGEKISEKKFLIGSEKIFSELKNFSDDGIILAKNFLEIRKETGLIFKNKSSKDDSDLNKKTGLRSKNPVENILKLNSQNLEILEKFENEFDFNIFDKLALNLVKDEDLLFLEKIKNSIFLLKSASEKIEEYEIFISMVLGKISPQTSVIFFQNSNELRPTGGFVGSFLVFTANNGKILDWKIHDIYEFDGQLKGNFEKIPFEAKALVGDENWSLRDFNVNPDLKISSENFNYFFEKAGGKTVDNFFYLDSKILGEILKISGPIELENLGISVDSNNWDFVFQYFVESKKNFPISPKKLMIGELFLGLKKNILDKKNISNLENYLNLSDLILNNYYIQAHLTGFNIGFVFPPKYLWEQGAKSFTSISGNKSDKFIENKWIHWREDNSEKIISVKRNFEINKNFDEFFEYLFGKFGSDIPKEELKRILGFGENNSILQIYTEKNFDLLFVKYIGNGTDEKTNLDFKKWKQGFVKGSSRNVFEINLPILKRGEKQEVFFNWKKK